jgi:hypothetical protein
MTYVHKKAVAINSIWSTHIYIDIEYNTDIDTYTNNNLRKKKKYVTTSVNVKSASVTQGVSLDTRARLQYRVSVLNF